MCATPRVFRVALAPLYCWPEALAAPALRAARSLANFAGRDIDVRSRAHLLQVRQPLRKQLQLVSLHNASDRQAFVCGHQVVAH